MALNVFLRKVVVKKIDENALLVNFIFRLRVTQWFVTREARHFFVIMMVQKRKESLDEKIIRLCTICVLDAIFFLYSPVCSLKFVFTN